MDGEDCSSVGLYSVPCVFSWVGSVQCSPQWAERFIGSHECWHRAFSLPPLSFIPFHPLLPSDVSCFIAFIFCHRFPSEHPPVCRCWMCEPGAKKMTFTTPVGLLFITVISLTPQDVVARSVCPVSRGKPSLHQLGESLALGAFYFPGHGVGCRSWERVGGRTVRLHLQHTTGRAAGQFHRDNIMIFTSCYYMWNAIEDLVSLIHGINIRGYIWYPTRKHSFISPAWLWKRLLWSVLPRLPHTSLVSSAPLCLHSNTPGGHVCSLSQQWRQEEAHTGVDAVWSTILHAKCTRLYNCIVCLFITFVGVFYFVFFRLILSHFKPYFILFCDIITHHVMSSLVMIYLSMSSFLATSCSGRVLSSVVKSYDGLLLLLSSCLMPGFVSSSHAISPCVAGFR